MAHPVGKFRCDNSPYECLHSLDAGPFMVSVRRFPPHFFQRKHLHTVPYLQGVLKGSLTESGLLHDQGSVGFLPAEEHRSQIHGGGLVAVILDIGEPALRLLPRVMTEPTNCFAPQLRFAMNSLVRELEQPDPFTPLAVEGIGYELLAIASRLSARSESSPRWVTRVVERIREEAGDPLTVEALAGEACVHPATLSRAFRRNLGCSVADYVRRVRLEKACELLAKTEFSVAAIAADTGFVDQSHLGRWFRRSYGVTPAEYRSSVRT